MHRKPERCGGDFPTVVVIMRGMGARMAKQLWTDRTASLVKAMRSRLCGWVERDQSFLAARFSLLETEYLALSEADLSKYPRERDAIDKLIDAVGQKEPTRNQVRRMSRLLVAVLPDKRLPFKLVGLNEEESQLRRRLGLTFKPVVRDEQKARPLRETVEALQEDVNLLSLRLHETDRFRGWVIAISIRYWLYALLVVATIFGVLAEASSDGPRCVGFLVAFAFVLGATGGLLSIVERTYRTPLHELVATAMVERPQKQTLMLSILLGGGMGVVAYLVGMSELFGKDFFDFRCLSVQSGETRTTPVTMFGETGAGSTFRMMAFCTIAGFAERWVPDLLNRAGNRWRIDALEALENVANPTLRDKSATGGGADTKDKQPPEKDRDEKAP